MSIKYQINYAQKIEKVEIERETESSVWINGSRLSKHSRYSAFFNTWEEAHAFILDKAERRVAAYARNLESATKSLKEIQSMKKDI